MDQQKGWKEYIGPVIGILLGIVVYEVFKGTAINGIIMAVVVGLFLIPSLVIECVRNLGRKAWGKALMGAVFAGIAVFVMWFALSDVPWHQLPEEIDMILNFYKTL